MARIRRIILRLRTRLVVFLVHGLAGEVAFATRLTQHRFAHVMHSPEVEGTVKLARETLEAATASELRIEST